MPRKIQPVYTKYRSKLIVAMGDSLTHNPTLGNPAEKFWPIVLAQKLNTLTPAPCTVTARNRGRSGNTTANTSPNMMYRSGWFFANGVPELAIIFGGANDPGNSISTSATTQNLQAMIKAVKFGVAATSGAGYVAGQANLPASIAPGTRYVVLSDTDSTGGAVAASGQTPTISGAVSADSAGNTQAVWESRNGQAGVLGWGRVAVASTLPDQCSRIIILSMHYLNFSSGGDTLSADYATYNATTGVRVAQVAAAAAEGVVYADQHAFFKSRIQAGIDAQGSFTWHYADSNQHLNVYGNELIAQFLLSTIQAQPGWLAALST